MGSSKKSIDVPSRYSHGFLNELERRSEVYRELRRFHDEVVADAGCPGALTRTKLALIERFVFLSALVLSRGGRPVAYRAAVQSGSPENRTQQNMVISQVGATSSRDYRCLIRILASRTALAASATAPACRKSPRKKPVVAVTPGSLESQRCSPDVTRACAAAPRDN